MKTSVVEVRDMLSVFSVDEVEKRIGEVPGVESVTVNFAAENATVRFDETQLEVADIKSAVRQRGFGPVAPADAVPSETHKGQASAGVAPAPAASAASTSTPARPTAASATAPDKTASPVTPDSASAGPPATPAADNGLKDQAAPEES